MRKPKILFIAESLQVGGAEKALVSLLHLLDYSKYDVTLMLISESGAFLNDAKAVNDLKIKHFVAPGKNGLISLINAIKIKSIYKWLPPYITGNHLCKGYDIVISFCEGYLTKWVAASNARCRKIAWVHTDMVDNDWPVKTHVYTTVEEERFAYKQFDDVVAVSDAVAIGLKRKFQLGSVTTIYNILDTDIINKSYQDIAYDPFRKLNLISVGRLEEVKGYSNLIHAIDMLVNQRGLDISLCLVGDGGQRSQLEKLAAENNLNEYIYFAGSQSNPYPYMAKACVYVCSSLKEGFNIALLEAMTLGLPVVSTDSAGPREILDNDKFGIITDNSVNGLVDAISRLYNDEKLLRYYKNMSISRSKFFDAGTQMRKIEQLLFI